MFWLLILLQKEWLQLDFGVTLVEMCLDFVLPFFLTTDSAGSIRVSTGE